MLVILDRGHNRPGSLHGGSTPDGRREVDLVAAYQAAAAKRLVELGIPVSLDGCGEPEPYAARWARACRAARDRGPAVYAQLHANAGRGHGAWWFFDTRSELGRAAATAAAGAYELAALPGIRGSSALACYDDRQKAGDAAWLVNPYSTIRGIFSGPLDLCGLCVEPAFMDQADHLPLFEPEGLALLGRAVADALAAGLRAVDFLLRTGPA